MPILVSSWLPMALESDRMKSKKKRVLILDPPDRRVIPTLGSVGKEYDFHFLIPLRKGFAFQKAVEATLRLCRPRNTRSISFLPFITEQDFKHGLIDFLKRHFVDAVLPYSERTQSKNISDALLVSLTSL